MAGRFRIRLMLPLLALMLSACAGAEPRPGEARIPKGAVVTHRAVFIGTNNHDTTGTISLYQSPSYPVIVFEPNFSVSDAAGAVVALGTNGYRADSALGGLLRPSGRQVYAVPRDLDLRNFNEVWLWSPYADKPIGLARLTAI